MNTEDREEELKNGIVIPLYKLDVDISAFPTHKSLRFGIDFLFGGPFYRQVFGIHLHLIVVSVQFDIFEKH